MRLERCSVASQGAPPPYPHWFSALSIASSSPEVSHGRTPTDVLKTAGKLEKVAAELEEYVGRLEAATSTSRLNSAAPYTMHA